MHNWKEIVAGKKLCNEHHPLLYVEFRSTFHRILLLLKTDEMLLVIYAVFRRKRSCLFHSTGNQYGYIMAYAATGRPYLSYTMSIGHKNKIPQSYCNPECIGYGTKCLRISALRTYVVLSTQTSKAQEMHMDFG